VAGESCQSPQYQYQHKNPNEYPNQVASLDSPAALFGAMTPGWTPGRSVKMGRAEILERLYGVITERMSERPDGSYVVSLLDDGIEAIAAKIREESEEVIDAARARDASHTAAEVADLFFHVWVLMAQVGVPPERVFAILEERFGVGGLVEKAGRDQGGRDDD
jgi:phosphoribosyl-ATP pyrophosphohydrolase